MASDTMQEVAWSLPTELIQRLEYAAIKRWRSVEDVITEILEAAFPPIETDGKRNSETSP